MFSVLFEVHPRQDQWDDYLGYARMLRPELEQIDGFLTNIRYRSLTREGWILSLSDWRDEKSLVRWRTQSGHHDIQGKGREAVLLDYHLRVGQYTYDTDPPEPLREQRLDETETGAGTAVTLSQAHQTDGIDSGDPDEAAIWLGLDLRAEGLIAWDVFDAVLSPGDLIVLASWRDQDAASAHQNRAARPDGSRQRRIRIVRDYGMFDRHEAPQYYPAVPSPAT